MWMHTFTNHKKLKEMNNEILLKDLSDVLWLLVGLCIAYLLYQALLYCYKEHEKDKEFRKMFLSESERNAQVMKSIEEACQYDERQIS